MKNNLVVKSNSLIQARYKLSLNEQKIILYSSSKLDRAKDDFNIIAIEVKDFFNLLNTSTERYTELREIVRELKNKEVIIDTGNGEIISNWLASIEYIKDTGIIELEFSTKLIPYLLQLKEQFTRYQLKNILYLNNKHSIRIYELLKQYETIGKREFKVDELKKILLLENQYKRFSNFEQRVLKPTMEEINEYTDIVVNYKKMKKGRSISSIEYSIRTKDKDVELQYINDTYDIDKMKEATGLENESFNSKQFMSIYERACNKMQDEYEDETDIFSYININYKDMLKKDNIRNRYSYLMDMLEHDRAKAIVYIRMDKETMKNDEE